jgi:hypothetical protein
MILYWWLWLGLSILVHELGHLYMAKRLGYTAKFSLFKITVLGDVSEQDDRKIILSGVIWGLLVVLFYFFNAPHIILGTGLLLVYLFGTKKEIKRLITR